jgi:DNA repair photolyase
LSFDFVDWLNRGCRVAPGFSRDTLAKVNAAELLRREVAHPSYKPEHIAIGVNTDASQPCEREHRLTRQAMNVLSECGHPVGMITKSALIERDITKSSSQNAIHEPGGCGANLRVRTTVINANP